MIDLMLKISQRKKDVKRDEELQFKFHFEF